MSINNLLIKKSENKSTNSGVLENKPKDYLRINLKRKVKEPSNENIKTLKKEIKEMA